MNKKHLTREALLKIIETDQAQCGETSALACIVLAAIDNEISLTRNIVPEEMNIGTAMKFWGGGRGSIHSFVAGYNLCRADMLAAVPQLPGSEPSTVPGKWIPVSERLPEAGGDMIVFTDGIVMSGVSYAKKKGFYIQALEYDDDEPVDGVTHWMPLPAPPTEVK
nr:MAG TPA: Protein of unknown function (DUF551) [Caudoviricetes sp.]